EHRRAHQCACAVPQILRRRVDKPKDGHKPQLLAKNGDVAYVAPSGGGCSGRGRAAAMPLLGVQLEIQREVCFKVAIESAPLERGADAVTDCVDNRHSDAAHGQLLCIRRWIAARVRSKSSTSRPSCLSPAAVM